MRRSALGAMLLAAGLTTDVAHAQAYQFETSPPQFTAASAEWQVNGEPVIYAGDVYSATPERLFFNGYVMVQVGWYRGVPIYVDATLEPYSIVYLPVGRNLMRRYERRRAGPLAGTEGSRPSWFPIENPPVNSPPGAGADVEESQPVATSGVVLLSTPTVSTASVAPLPARRGAQVEARLPMTVGGVWVEYDGLRWYSAGPAVQRSPNAFVWIGDYHGFPVFRARSARSDLIYIEAVDGGLLTPYSPAVMFGASPCALLRRVSSRLR